MTPGLVALVIDKALEMARLAGKAGDVRQQYGHTRDALWFALAFLACLRKSESVGLTEEHLTEGTEKDALHLFIPFSKNDQEGVGVTLPIKGTTASGISLRATLREHKRSMRACGVERGGPLFGFMDDPGTRLEKLDTCLARLRRLYFPALAEEDAFHVPDWLRFSGHSFRRGGINAVRDAARAAGVEDAALTTQLMRYGRWRDPRSLLIYLNDNWAALTALTARV
jgi:hypothetical protein